MRFQTKYLLAITLCVSVLGAFVAISSMARTPDGVTPAEETVCDGLVGAAFGLCNAYCEAQDCDILDPQRESCELLRENFERITGTWNFPCDCGNGVLEGDEECEMGVACATSGQNCSACICHGGAVPCGDAELPECDGSCPEDGECEAPLFGDSCECSGPD